QRTATARAAGACRNRARRPAAAASRYQQPPVPRGCGWGISAAAPRLPARGFPGSRGFPDSREARPARTGHRAARAADSGPMLTLRSASRSAGRAGGPALPAPIQAALRPRLTAPAAAAAVRPLAEIWLAALAIALLAVRSVSRAQPCPDLAPAEHPQVASFRGGGILHGHQDGGRHGMPIIVGPAVGVAPRDCLVEFLFGGGGPLRPACHDL